MNAVTAHSEENPPPVDCHQRDGRVHLDSPPNLGRPIMPQIAPIVGVPFEVPAGSVVAWLRRRRPLFASLRGGH